MGRGRGATYWDEVEDVCWLLAYGDTHATHEDRDVYKHFMSLSDKDLLLPTPDDYEALERISSANLLDEFRAIGRTAYEEARANPGTEVQYSGLLDDSELLVVIDLYVIEKEQCEEGWVSWILPRDTPFSEGQVYDLLEAILPDNVDLDTLRQAATVGSRPVRYDEIAWTWSTYASE
ncbi:hypothetical protein ELQ93_02840 [Labedella gwakjiensis]|uniref:DUF4240 domain-containing protein n=1 Tax=Labedella gwakjiensis TaxID=390269 RepID=A0ABY0C7D3_9MICO|nr:hypothetical protein ELQ93_02840 [Labedella gwakjiensis]